MHRLPYFASISMGNDCGRLQLPAYLRFILPAERRIHGKFVIRK